MKFSVALFAFFCVISKVKGLELDLDLNTRETPGHRQVCGILTCREIYTTDLSNKTTGSASAQRIISSLSIFKVKQVSHSAFNEDNSGGEALVASVTKNRPEITRLSDGVKVEGVLESGRATLRLEMVKERDCAAPYTCEIRTTDSQGTELVQTNRLQQRPNQNEGRSGGLSMTLGMMSQQLALLQQQMTSLGASLNAVEHRLEDKIETRVVDKLCQIEMKFHGTDENELAAKTTLGEIEVSLAALKKELKDENQMALRLNTLAISNSTSEIVNAVQRQTTEILTWEQRDQQRFNMLMAAKEIIINSSEELRHGVQSDFSELHDNLFKNFEELKTGVQNTTTETLFAVHSLIADTNMTMWNSLKPVVFDILSPNECRKGMFPSLLGTTFPYHVIQPDGVRGLDAPYLCDSVTDGGGWLVFQRRSSGGQDFYKSWEEYKNGFGNLYDDFWWGNEKLHVLTTSGRYELRVDVKYKGKSAFAHYSSFSLDGENNDYILRLGSYDGTAGDSLTWHNGKPFSAKDRDNDGHSPNNAVDYSGAWWYYGGYNSNLNAMWSTSGNKGARWPNFSGNDCVSFSEMKIRIL